MSPSALLLAFSLSFLFPPLTYVAQPLDAQHIIHLQQSHARQERRVWVLQVKNPFHADYDPRVTLTQTIDDPTSITAMINRLQVLPADYSPPDLMNVRSLIPDNPHVYLRSEALHAFVALHHTIYNRFRIRVYVRSGYRSYTTQHRIFSRFVQNVGYARATTFSAKPGQSEHQSGLALDLEQAGYSMLDFHHSRAYPFMLTHAHLYGFTLSYPSTMSYMTSYTYEPWHWRYVGVELATYLFEHQLTLNALWLRQP